MTLRDRRRVGFAVTAATVAWYSGAASGSPASAAKPPTSYTQLAVLAVTGQPLASFDIGWSDRTGTYYLADKTNAAIDFIDGKTGTMLGQATGFAGVKATQSLSGPNGVVSAPNLHEIWAGDGDSTVKVVDAKTFTVTDTISTGGYQPSR